jgi:hypothetical protein
MGNNAMRCQKRNAVKDIGGGGVVELLVFQAIHN